MHCTLIQHSEQLFTRYRTYITFLLNLFSNTNNIAS